MTIEEAIKVISELRQIVFIAKSLDRNKALRLGIEALKEIKKERKGTFTILLPSETENCERIGAVK